MRSRVLPTGIDVLDRKLSGGIPAGSVVAITAPPASQSELLLYELTASRVTLYLSTQRSAEAVQDAIDRTPARTGNATVRRIDADAPLDHVNRLIRALPEGSNLIVDPVDVLEREGVSRYQHFMNTLQTAMVNTGSLAFLHGLDGRAVPDNRDVTAYMADAVFELETRVSGEAIENRLAVPKFRGSSALDETIKLSLEERVEIDTSRDIA